MRLNFDTEFFESLFDGEAVIQDKNEEYEIPNVGKFNLKFFDTKYFIQGVEYFRPFIRGFIALMICLFHVRMALSFIRQDAGFVTGKAVSVSAKEDKK